MKGMCPFYISNGKKNIRCESPLGKMTQAVTEFEDADQKERYMEQRCRDPYYWDACPHFRICAQVLEENLYNADLR